MKKSKALIVSFVLGAMYLVYLIWYLVDISSQVNTLQAAQAIGTVLAVKLIEPHAVCVGVAVLFNGLGAFMNKRGFALAGGILYLVSIALMPIYFMFVIIQAILSFIGYSKLERNKDHFKWSLFIFI